MTIEKLLQDGIAALEANTAAVVTLHETWAALVEQGKTIKAGDVKAEGLAAGGKTVVPPSGAGAKGKSSGASTASSKKGSASQEEPEGPTREEVSAAIVSLCAKTSRERALEVLEPYGAVSGKTVKEKDFAAVLGDVNAAIAEAEME